MSKVLASSGFVMMSGALPAHDRVGLIGWLFVLNISNGCQLVVLGCRLFSCDESCNDSRCLVFSWAVPSTGEAPTGRLENEPVNWVRLKERLLWWLWLLLITVASTCVEVRNSSTPGLVWLGRIWLLLGIGSFIVRLIEVRANSPFRWCIESIELIESLASFDGAAELNTTSFRAGLLLITPNSLLTSACSTLM